MKKEQRQTLEAIGLDLRENTYFVALDIRTQLS